MPNIDLPKWTVLRIWCGHLAQPHDKFCITINSDSGLFFFINSDPPPFRKAKELAVEIQNYEAVFLNHTSYVDSTKCEIFPEKEILQALKDPDRNHGLLIKTVRQRIKDMVASHDVLEPNYKTAVLDD